MCISYVKEFPHIRYAELTEKAGLSKAIVERIMKSLKEKGLIERVGSDKTGVLVRFFD